jgi:hypothetical protein
MCKFLHIRKMLHGADENGTDDKPEGKGGKTVAFEVNDTDNVIFFTVATCGPKYNFNRRLGRIVSEGMLNCKRPKSIERHVRAIGFTKGENPYEVLRKHING